MADVVDVLDMANVVDVLDVADVADVAAPARMVYASNSVAVFDPRRRALGLFEVPRGPRDDLA